MKKIKVVLVEPGKEARVTEIDRTLELFGKQEVLARIASGLAIA